MLYLCKWKVLCYDYILQYLCTENNIKCWGTTKPGWIRHREYLASHAGHPCQLAWGLCRVRLGAVLAICFSYSILAEGFPIPVPRFPKVLFLSTPKLFLFFPYIARGQTYSPTAPFCCWVLSPFASFLSLLLRIFGLGCCDWANVICGGGVVETSTSQVSKRE